LDSPFCRQLQADVNESIDLIKRQRMLGGDEPQAADILSPLARMLDFEL
jgi:hypothetical protein